MNCSDCVDRLDRLVDRELTEQEMEEAKQHLTHCGSCSDRYRFQADFKRVIRVCCGQEKAPAELREKLTRLLF